MVAFLTVIAVVAAAAVAIAFLYRFYRKATRERALIRTGLGGQKVVMDGGLLVLPFLHRVEDINMRTMRLEVGRTGARSLMTEDRLRVDVEMTLYVRVTPTREGVATAAQSLGARALRPEELTSLFEGRVVDAMQAAAAARAMDALHEDRAGYVATVRELLAETLAANGLRLDSASLVRLDQTSFAELDENNAFNAVGMRRLAEVISDNKKRRKEIEADADLAVRRTELDSMKRRLDLEREQQEAEIDQRRALEERKAESESATEAARQRAERASEEARLERERGLRVAEIERDLTLRRHEVQALLDAETAKIDSHIALAAKRGEEAAADAAAESARTQVVTAQEQVRAETERLAAERERAVGLIRAQGEAETSAERVRGEIATMLERARADAEAAEHTAAAKRRDMQADADGRAAMIAAENTQSGPLMRQTLDMHRLDRLPDLAERMVKPVEKIDSIRINHVGGLGQAGAANGAGLGDGRAPYRSSVAGAVDGVLDMALQLPAMQKLGRAIGLNLDLGEMDEPDGPGAARDRTDGDGDTAARD